jgi:hypothetical protein
MYAISLNAPVTILLGNDNLYWVIDEHTAGDWLDKGFSPLIAAH